MIPLPAALLAHWPVLKDLHLTVAMVFGSSFILFGLFALLLCLMFGQRRGISGTDYLELGSVFVILGGVFLVLGLYAMCGFLLLAVGCLSLVLIGRLRSIAAKPN